MDIVTGPLDGYDYLTFVFLVLAIIAFFYAVIQIGGLPGKLAERRNHPHAESVKIVGWIGLFTVFPWIHALIWAYHDSLTIDVRKFPGLARTDPAPEGTEVPAGSDEEQSGDRK
jgi:Protein of unknown function (DUF3302)